MSAQGFRWGGDVSPTNGEEVITLREADQNSGAAFRYGYRRGAEDGRRGLARWWFWATAGSALVNLIVGSWLMAGLWAAFSVVWLVLAKGRVFRSHRGLPKAN